MSNHKIKENLVFAGLCLKELGVAAFNAVTPLTDLATITGLLKSEANSPANKIKKYKYTNSGVSASNFNAFYDSYHFEGEVVNADPDKNVKWVMHVVVDTQLGVKFELTMHSGKQRDNAGEEMLQVIVSRDQPNFARYGRHNTVQVTLLTALSALITQMTLGDIDEEVEYFSLNHQAS